MANNIEGKQVIQGEGGILKNVNNGGGINVEQADRHVWGDLSKEGKMSLSKILRFHLYNNPLIH